MREGDTASPTKDLLTWTALAISTYYFEDHGTHVPKSSKDLLAFLVQTLNTNAATQFLSTYSRSTDASTSLS